MELDVCEDYVDIEFVVVDYFDVDCCVVFMLLFVCEGFE